MIPADLKAYVKQKEIKELVTVSYKFLYEVLLEHELQCKQGVYFFNFGWYSIQLDIVCKEQRGWGGGLLNGQNPSSVTNVI